ncbi:MAG TPA: cytochrome c oxidase subunit II [Methylocella sp.]|nr:cytochrome c oxidase subunit II [Methylocella sp.]
MTLALVLVLIVLGSTLFHLLSPWWLTPIASNWGDIDGTINLTFWITGIGYIAIILFMAFCVFRFRHKPGRRAAYQPENNLLEWSLAIGTTVAVVALLGPGLFVWYQFITIPKEAAEIEVVGQQWQWSFRLPGKNGRLGTTDPQYISSDNPLGLNPNDPNGQDNVVIVADDLHLLVGKPVKVLLRSIDVVHDFYVPEFRAKMDLMPGLVTHFWFIPTKTGNFEILCAAFCGIGHPQMRGSVVVEKEEDYRAWLRKQKTFAELSADVKKAYLTQ